MIVELLRSSLTFTDDFRSYYEQEEEEKEEALHAG